MTSLWVAFSITFILRTVRFHNLLEELLFPMMFLSVAISPGLFLTRSFFFVFTFTWQVRMLHPKSHYSNGFYLSFEVTIILNDMITIFLPIFFFLHFLQWEVVHDGINKITIEKNLNVNNNRPHLLHFLLILVGN